MKSITDREVRRECYARQSRTTQLVEEGEIVLLVDDTRYMPVKPRGRYIGQVVYLLLS